MAKEEAIGVEGRVVERMRNSRYRVELKGGHLVLAYVAGKIRWQAGRNLEGDQVGVMLSPYDLTQGRIVYLVKPQANRTEGR
jgi:translation initiation factor IF-1